MTDKDIWQEGADDRECEDCGCTCHSCTCYEKECFECGATIKYGTSITWNDDWYCDDVCLVTHLNY